MRKFLFTLKFTSLKFCIKVNIYMSVNIYFYLFIYYLLLPARLIFIYIIPHSTKKSHFSCKLFSQKIKYIKLDPPKKLAELIQINSDYLIFFISNRDNTF
jgi:hypothetical protein